MLRTGLSVALVRNHLLSEKDLTYDKAVKVLLGLETVDHEVKDIQGQRHVVN